MNSDYLFLLGSGHLPKLAARIAAKHGATLVNYTDPGCSCGYRCTSGDCPANRRHWFAGPNLGEPLPENFADALALGFGGQKTNSAQVLTATIHALSAHVDEATVLRAAQQWKETGFLQCWCVVGDIERDAMQEAIDKIHASALPLNNSIALALEKTLAL